MQYVAFLQEIKSDFSYFIGVFSTEKKAEVAALYAKSKSPIKNRVSIKILRVVEDDPNIEFNIHALESLLDMKKSS